jgi:hypothetical protein
MKKLLKYGAFAGTAMALMPLAARAAEDDMVTDYTVTSTADTAAATAAGGALLGGLLIFWLVFAVIGLALFIFWIFMLIDCIKRTNWKQESDKNLWLILLIVGLVIGVGPIAAIVYYFAVKRQLDAKKPAAK